MCYELFYCSLQAYLKDLYSFVMFYIILVCCVLLWVDLFSAAKRNKSLKNACNVLTFPIFFWTALLIQWNVLSLIKLNFHIVYYTFCQSAQKRTWNILLCIMLCCPFLPCILLYCTKLFQALICADWLIYLRYKVKNIF